MTTGDVYALPAPPHHLVMLVYSLGGPKAYRPEPLIPCAICRVDHMPGSCSSPTWSRHAKCMMTSAPLETAGPKSLASSKSRGITPRIEIGLLRRLLREGGCEQVNAKMQPIQLLKHRDQAQHVLAGSSLLRSVMYLHTNNSVLQTVYTVAGANSSANCSS